MLATNAVSCSAPVAGRGTVKQANGVRLHAAMELGWIGRLLTALNSPRPRANSRRGASAREGAVDQETYDKRGKAAFVQMQAQKSSSVTKYPLGTD